MKRIIADKRKGMVLTTRTNILNKSKSLSDVFNHEKIDKKEYEINVSQLTDLEKTSMLYNHIWHGLGSDELSDIFFENKNYWRVIKHKNFNPRLISYITDKDRLSGIRKNTYWDYIQNALDNPEVIWDHCFNNQTPDEVLDLVCLIVFSGNNIYEGDCESALKRVFKIKYPNQFLSKVNKIGSYIRESLKSTVTRTLVLHKSKRYPILSPFNPSVSDYIINRFSKDEDTLFLYFDALRTTSSLNSLFALRKNRTISSEIFSFVFEPILNRLKGGSLDGYSVRLYALVINSDTHERQKLSIVDHHAFLNINENVLTYDQEVGECLYWLALKRRELFSESFVKSIINYALRTNRNSTLSHEDCVPLAQLINLFPEVKGDEETALIINAIKTYWETNIEDYILNSRRIQDIHDNLPNTGDIAFDIIKDMVKEYDLPFVGDDLESIFDNVRIDCLYPDDDYLSDRSGRVSDYAKNIGRDSIRDIDDLFSR